MGLEPQKPGNFKTRFSVKLRKGIVNNEPSKTKQAFKDESDMNNILKKYAATGALPLNIKENPVYGDYSSVPDYQTALNTIQKAEQQFLGLPSELRDRLQNDPSLFLDYVNDPKNSDELIKYGLKEQPIISEPINNEVKTSKKASKTESDAH
ncbi:MAG: internal scaffolding protein [Arizlama microvirus]|nr:MAG: internal scaffolding protein [Arizlama microvirus]